MGVYTKQRFEKAMKDYDEVIFVLESNSEYKVKSGEYEFVTGNYVKVQAIRQTTPTSETVTVEFPVEAVEHHYVHEE